MKIDEKLVKHVADLSRINVTQEEIPNLVSYMQQVLGHFEELSKINTDNVEPFISPVFESAQENLSSRIFREDSKKDSLNVHQVLKNAPLFQEGQFKIKSVIDEI